MLHEERMYVEALARELESRKEKGKIVLILGSRAGALFRSQEFIETMFFRGLKSPATFSYLERFSEAYSILENEKQKNPPEDLKILLTSVIDNTLHATEDSSLAELVRQNIFKAIFSLNMDDLLLSTFIRHGMKQNLDFADFSFGLWPPEATVKDILTYSQMHICKLIRMYKDEQSFVRQLADAEAQQKIIRSIQSLLTKWKVQELLIVGWDRAWDRLLPLALPASIKTIFFVNEDETAKDIFLQRIASCEHFYYLSMNYRSFCNNLRAQIAPDFMLSQDFNREVIHGIITLRTEFQELQKNVQHVEQRLDQLQETLFSIQEHIIHEILTNLQQSSRQQSEHPSREKGTT